jgi:uncharacterized coiled-coil protein SlyX
MDVDVNKIIEKLQMIIGQQAVQIAALQVVVDELQAKLGDNNGTKQDSQS